MQHLKFRKIVIMGLIALAAGAALEVRSLPLIPWHRGVVYSVPTKDKVIALTFDDGPHPLYTPQILSLLRKHHAKATFFMIGNRMEQYPSLVKAVIAGGNAVGNHTYTHPHQIEACTPARITKEIDQCEAVFHRITGRHPYLFRPPLGRIDKEILDDLETRGYKTILWTVSADHHDAPTPKLMAQRVFDQARPGAIVLIHDGRFPSRWKDVAATALILDGLSRQGYRFVTVPELLKSASQP